ncbi:signal recognition particle-docking protein FtsY [Tropheryma whipplei]|uniref:signal recognition particle-docking protein FtsY n=1 Tax=Tropheryma whipplei TaxID=2039 RepID=UPI000571FD26|nr:signal recognition particle-docking protein FtsY [Tropheryma whipplei]
MFRRVFDKEALKGVVSHGTSSLFEILLRADFGYSVAHDIVASIGNKSNVDDRERCLREYLECRLSSFDPTLRLTNHPSVILIVGVNGVGKTATAGKLANLLRLRGKKVLLAAADTFRAAAVEQLSIWAQRAGVEIITPPKPRIDPASVAYSSVKKAIDDNYDVVVIDTAGRLHNKANLMAELERIARVTEKLVSIDEVLLVLDATTGQNGLTQARSFLEAVSVTGIVLSKTDSSAKAGFIFQAQESTGVPVKLIGTGEAIDDIAGFAPYAFVAQIFG